MDRYYPTEIPADSVLIDSAISMNPPGRQAIALLVKPYDAASDQALASYLKRYGNVPKLTTDHAHLAGLRQVLGFASSDDSTSNSKETGISLDVRTEPADVRPAESRTATSLLRPTASVDQRPAVIAGIGGFVRRLLRRKPRE
jgi:hypothetical protein